MCWDYYILCTSLHVLHQLHKFKQEENIYRINEYTNIIFRYGLPNTET